MAPLQECPCPVLSVTLTAKEHVSYSIFWSSHTPEVPLSWMCRSAPKETVGLGKVSGTVKQPGTVSWTGRGRREKMMTEGRGHKQEEGSVSFHSDLCVQTGEGENSVPTAFCVF